MKMQSMPKIIKKSLPIYYELIVNSFKSTFLQNCFLLPKTLYVFLNFYLSIMTKNIFQLASVLNKRIIKQLSKRYLLACCCLFLIPSLTYAQMTSASLSGTITNTKGEKVKDVAVVIGSIATGEKYTTTSNEQGIYSVYGINPGLMYNIEFTNQDYKPFVKEEMLLRLGVNDFNIQLSSTNEELANVNLVGKKRNIAVAAIMDENKIKSLPTISRSIQDITRLVPNSTNGSFGGSNFRYNNVTVDGAINNDAIGFSPSLGGQSGTSGMPGSSTRTNSISLDAIQDMQVYTAPYDVKIGNFLGGSINAVTRRGTNDVKGSVYFYGRNAILTGPNNAGDKAAMPSDFSEFQTGLRIGVPIVKDKVFFFGNEEITYRQDPLFYGAGSVGSLISQDSANNLQKFVNNKYGFDIGGGNNYNIYSKSIKFFNRLDFHLSDKHQFLIRNNTTIGEATNLERDAANFRFSSIDFKQNNTQVSTVAELKSRFHNRLSNSLILGYSSISDYRTPLSGDINRPQVEIGYNGGTIFLGNDREATVFNLQQNTIEITDNLNYSVGKHNLTFGTHNELYRITYGFVSALNGRVAYSSIADFYAGKASRDRGSYSFSGATRQDIFNNPSSKFNVNLWSIYGQDEFVINSKLKLTLGLRLDLTQLPTMPTLYDSLKNTTIDTKAGTTYTNTTMSQIKNDFFGQVVFSPRFGFVYDVLGTKEVIIKGGTGIFTGRIPFAWLGYAYYNDGKNYGSYDKKSLDPTKGDPFLNPQDAAKQNGVVNNRQVDLIDNNFQIPQVWRSNLNIEYNVSGYKFNLEGVFTKVIYDIKFQQINMPENVKYFAYDEKKEMPIYDNTKINSQLSNAYLLSNTDQGYRYNIITQLAKTYPFGLNFSASYSYGESFDISNGIRNSMESNWQLNPSLSPNNPQLSYSNFDIRHRIVTTIGYRHKWNNNHATTFQTVLTMQSGSPFTWGFIGSTLNNTGQNIGLAYIFKDVASATPYFKTTDDAQRFVNFVNADKYLSSRKGNFTERNTGRTPWNINADFKILHDVLVVNTHTLQLSLDIMNVTNLLNTEWGKVYFVPNTFNSVSSIGLTNNATNGATPQFVFQTPNTPYIIDQFASRWQMQIGVRYTF